MPNPRVQVDVLRHDWEWYRCPRCGDWRLPSEGESLCFDQLLEERFDNLKQLKLREQVAA